jgi:DNA-binding MarR family transcriptional regulator
VSQRESPEAGRTRPGRLEEETTLSILRTAEALMQEIGEVLRSWELSTAQYNVLRILRGAGPAGATCKDIGERLITRDPDVTRLLDRLARRELITRDRSRHDRRFVTVRLAPAGVALVSELDAPIAQLHARLMKELEPRHLRVLVALLGRVRGGAGPVARA